MTQTIYYTATTLDGYIADPHDSLDWLFIQPNDPDGEFGYKDFITKVGALVMGATTYQWIRDHMAETGEAWSYEAPTWVLTHRTFEPLDGADVRFAQGDVAVLHPEFVSAAADRDIWVVGGGDLAGQFADHGLLDEIQVSIAPVTLGAGRPLFPRAHDLELLEHGVNGAFVCARYRVVGPRG